MDVPRYLCTTEAVVIITCRRLSCRPGHSPELSEGRSGAQVELGAVRRLDIPAAIGEETFLLTLHIFDVPPFHLPPSTPTFPSNSPKPLKTIAYFRVSRPIHKIKVYTHVAIYIFANHTSCPKPTNPPPGSYSPTIISPHPSQSSPHRLCNCIRVHLRLRLSSACSCATIRYRPLAYNRQLPPNCASTTYTFRHIFDTLSDNNRRPVPHLRSLQNPPKEALVFFLKTSPPCESPGHLPSDQRKTNNKHIKQNNTTLQTRD